MLAPHADLDRAFASLAFATSIRLRDRLPLISVIIPVHDGWPVTRACLESLVACDIEIAIEIIVVDDASTDETGDRLAALGGVDVIRNGENYGFVYSCNRGAALARGAYLYFLNNDTELAPHALRTLIARMESSARIGIVGSKLLYPDGRLQEAGGVIWSDGSGCNYGRYDSASDAKYNFVRDVDYVSGASLLVRTDLFRALGGFDQRFAPGYYEDADLCFAARARGFRVVYEPASAITHIEGASAGTDLAAGMKRFQPINQAAFREKWAGVLAREHAPPTSNLDRAARARGRERQAILIVDAYVPLYDKEAGSSRLQALITGFQAAGLRVVFFPDDLMPVEPYTADLERRGIEVVYASRDAETDWRARFRAALDTVDAVWICRPVLTKKYLPIARERPNISIIYDTIDLHHVRRRRQLELEGRADDTSWRDLEELELSCAYAADGTVVVSASEAAVLVESGVDPIAVVPTIHDLQPVGTNGYDATDGILFIGGYKHAPNVDSVIWLVGEIMPLVWESIPEAVVTLLGADPTPEVLALAGPRVRVPGFIHDVSAHFRSTRIFVAPIRFGAGVKGKIGEALSYGVPVVTTPIGAEGFAFVHDESALIAADAPAFAEQIVRLWSDRDRWETLSGAAAHVLTPFASKTVVADALSFVRDVAKRVRATAKG